MGDVKGSGGVQVSLGKKRVGQTNKQTKKEQRKGGVGKRRGEEGKESFCVSIFVYFLAF